MVTMTSAKVGEFVVSVTKINEDEYNITAKRIKQLPSAEQILDSLE